MDRHFILGQYGVPTRQTVSYDRIYAYDVCQVPVKDIFARYFNNRGGREGAMDKHIKEIAKAIVEAGTMSAFPPITVDINTLTIADGHCRMDAATSVAEAGVLDSVVIRVIFEDIPEDKFDDRVIELNMGQQSWGLLDFIYNYSNRGFESFTRLIDFCKDNELLHSADGKIQPRYGGAALRIPANSLKNVSLVITDEDIRTGKEAITEASEIRRLLSTNIHSNGGGWLEPFLRAWSEYRVNLADVNFQQYLREVKHCIDHRRREVTVPYGSNKKQDWNAFFRTVRTYM